MVEISTKYKIGTRRFGLINWIGFWTLYKRSFKISYSLDSNSFIPNNLFFCSFGSFCCNWNNRSDMLGFPFMVFLAPGLIAMQIIQQAFSHSSSSFMIGKIQGNIVDILYAPLSAGEVTFCSKLGCYN